MEIDKKLAELNHDLRLIAVRCKGNRLYLRGTFPPKPGDGTKPKHYEIATGKPATPPGLKQVRAIALLSKPHGIMGLRIVLKSLIVLGWAIHIKADGRGIA